MNCGRRYCIIFHLILNLLPHYLAKFECLTVQLYRIVIQFKSIYEIINIYSAHLQRCHILDHMSMPINLQYYSMCSKYLPSARRHALSRAHHLSMDSSMTRCSVPSQAFSRHCRNLLRWCDDKWHQLHSEKTTKLK